MTQTSSIDNSVKLTEKETQLILTPFAFKIDQSLFGISLAKPWKRASALLIDLAIIAYLSEAPGELLAIVLAFTFYRLGNNKRAEKMGQINGRKRRAFLRLIGAIMIFSLLIGYLPQLFDGFASNHKQSKSIINNDDVIMSDTSLKNVLVISAFSIALDKSIKQSQCQELNCWKNEFDSFLQADDELKSLSLTDSEIKKLMRKLIKKTKLSTDDQNKLFTYSYDQYVKNYQQLVNNDGIEKTQPETNYSIIEWFKGIINDLGLGFGWAAFYFTVFTALWHGQTLGKKFFGIRVLQLDGTPLSIWDSFGRYGGYGAGIATGLLGFLQVFWDPNRQAIHDKISSTVVINVEKNEANSN